MQRGFFSSLFDFSFSSYVTLRIIKVLYVILVVIAALYGLGILFAIASNGGAAIILALIAAPVAFLLFVVYARVLLKFVSVVFRIGENTEILARGGGPMRPGDSDRPPLA